MVLATYTATGAYVAIRFLRPMLWADPEFLARFRGEAHHLVELENPHVVRLHEYVETPTSAALVTELVDGVSLRVILTEHRTMSPEAALTLFKGALLGLSAAHDTGVAHRAVKPENVYVQADGTSKIADFGLAMPGGPPPYPMPSGGAGLGERAADLYMATCVFVECLTGRPPREEDPAGNVPSSVRALVAAGLAVPPAAGPPRPLDGRAFVEDLEEAARAAYGPAWEKRGRRHLAELATMLALRFPLANAAPGARASAAASRRGQASRAHPRIEPVPESGSSSGPGAAAGTGPGERSAAGRWARRVGGARRLPRTRAPYRPKPRFAIMATLAAVAATAVLLSADRGPSDGVPDTFLAPPPREPHDGDPALPTGGDAGEEPGERTAPAPEATTAAPQRPTDTPRPTSGAASPAPTGGRPAGAAQGVSALSIASFDGGKGTINLRAGAATRVTVTARFAEGPAPDRLVEAPAQTFTLSGSSAYAPVVAHAYAAPPCGTTLYRRLTVTTSPGGGTASRTTTVAGVPCSAPAVRDVRVVAWNGSAGTVRVTVDGTGPVRLSVSYTRRDDDGLARTRDTETRTLKGSRTYTVALAGEPGAVACGRRAHLGVVVTTSRAAANGPQVSEAVLDGPACPRPTPGEPDETSETGGGETPPPDEPPGTADALQTKETPQTGDAPRTWDAPRTAEAPRSGEAGDPEDGAGPVGDLPAVAEPPADDGLL
ncbi:hypothetical protein Misp01_35530 [Microtetraspora sp. NBRC 13810]|nr:hypothetical protein Misp01_35530 [Microtetraspora sp. NBRC 13810]